MERRTFLKGILGTVGAATLPFDFEALPAAPARPKPLAVCREDGWHYISAVTTFYHRGQEDKVARMVLMVNGKPGGATAITLVTPDVKVHTYLQCQVKLSPDDTLDLLILEPDGTERRFDRNRCDGFLVDGISC